MDRSKTPGHIPFQGVQPPKMDPGHCDVAYGEVKDRIIHWLDHFEPPTPTLTVEIPAGMTINQPVREGQPIDYDLRMQQETLTRGVGVGEEESILVGIEVNKFFFEVAMDKSMRTVCSSKHYSFPEMKKRRHHFKQMLERAMKEGIIDENTE